MTRIQRLAAGGTLLSVAAAIVPAAPAWGQDFSFSGTPMSDELASQSAVQQVVDGGVALGDTLTARGDAARFYAQRNGAPAWIERGRLTGDAEDLIVALQGADAHGLDPNAYHLAAMATAVDSRGRVQRGAEAAVDALMTDAFMMYAGQLLNGAVNPESLAEDIDASMEARDMVAALEFALSRGDVQDTLDGFAPTHPQYRMLQDAYARYRDAARTAPWPTVADGETLKVGMTDPRVQQIRARLDAEAAFDAGVATADDRGFIPALFQRAEPAAEPAPPAADMAAPAPDPNLYDEALAARIEAFQARHGLATDGAVGPNTLAMLNQGLAERAETIRMNLERWRWLPNDLGDRYLLVNAPQYRLHGYENGRETLDMKVIVGQPGHATPQFSDQMEYVVPNPRWHVTYNIATSETLYKVRNDIGYLARNNMAVYRDGRRVDPYSVNWNAYGRGNFPFQFVQMPGDDNALGRIKFIFPNNHSVYLHDTNTPELFDKDMRALSHGCIRVSQPWELARWVADGDAQLSYSDIQATLDSGKTEQLMLGKPLPVHIAYFTAWAEDDGAVDFYGDIYGRDARMHAAMFGAS